MFKVLVGLVQYCTWIAFTSTSDSVSMTSCVMMFITVVGDNVW